jgi:hypothetical protein
MAKSWRPTWARVMMWVLLPAAGLGLLFLLVRRTASVDAAVDEQRHGVQVRLMGEGASRLAELLKGSLSDVSSVGGSASPAPIRPHIAIVPDSERAAPHSFLIPGEVPSLISTTPLSPAEHGSSPTSNNRIDDAADRTVLAADVRQARQAFAHAGAPSGGVLVVLPDGRRMALDRPIIVGRDPINDGTHGEAVCVPLGGDLVSKTHAVIGPSGAGAWVIDGHSTNGTSVVKGSGERSCPPGVRVEVAVGATVVVGDVRLGLVAS